MFWTALAQLESVSVDVAKGSAQLCLADSFVIDAHDIVSALTRAMTKPASYSFLVQWVKPTTRATVRDITNCFDLSYVNTSAKLVWTGSEKGFSFQSSDAEGTVTDFAEIGNEQNGAFFV